MYYLQKYAFNVLGLFLIKLNHLMDFIYILNWDHKNIFLLEDQRRNIKFYFLVDTFNKLCNITY